MMPKALLLTTICFFSLNSAGAQDILTKTNGSIIQVKLIAIYPSKITFKNWEDLEGPVRTISRRQITSVTYANGEKGNLTIEKKQSEKDKDPADHEYGKNSVVFYPASATNTSAIGIGAAYERMLGERYLFSVYLPVTYSFDNPYSTARQATMLWVNPGGRFYPKGNAGNVRMGLGPSLFFGFGHQQFHTQYSNYQTGVTQFYKVNDPVFMMGLMANFSLNLQPSKKWIAGFDFGIGIPFFVDDGLPDNNNGYYSDYLYDPENPIFNFQAKIGYRF